MSILFPLCQLRRNVSCAKGNPFIHILEYSTPRLKLKPKFEFQTPLARDSPAGTSESIRFGANQDLRWNCPADTQELIPFCARLYILLVLRFPDIPYWNSSLFYPVGVYSAYFFMCDFIFPRWGFTIILLSWGTTWMMKAKQNRRNKTPKNIDHITCNDCGGERPPCEEL